MSNRFVLALFLSAVAATTAQAVVTPPGAAAYTQVDIDQLQANWTPNGNLVGTTYYAILSTGASPSTNNFTTNIASATGTNLFALFTGLQPNTTYFVDVSARDDSGGISAFTSLSSTVTLAGTPGPVSASGIFAAQVTANWTPGFNPAGTLYRAQISLDPGFSTVAASSDTINTSTLFNGLTSNTTYYLRVSAVNHAGVLSAPTSTLAARTLPGAPGAAPFSAISVTSLQANWTAPANSAGNSYQAILSSGPNPSTNNLANNQSSTTLNTFALFQSLSPNTLYFVDVKTINNSGSSTFTALQSTVTLALQPGTPNASLILSTQVTANWTSGGNPVGTDYRAEISLDQGFSTIAGSSDTAGTTALFGGLSPNTTYYLRVSAVNQAGVPSTPTDPISVRTLPGAPGAAPFSAISVTSLQVNWTAPANSAGNSYQVILSSGPNPSTNNLANNQSSTTLNTFALFQSLSPNTVYYADVKAVNASGNSSFASVGSTVTLALQPGPLSASVILSTQVTANWTSGGNPAGTDYLAQISLDPGFSTTAASSATANTSAVFSNLAANTTYYLRVSALNHAGAASTPTDPISVRTLPGAPGAAPFSAVSVTSLQANWTPPANSTGNSYQAILSSGPNPSTNNLANNQSSTTFNTFATFQSLSPNSVYFVDVKAINSSGNSAFASLGSTVTLALPPGAANPSVILSSQVTANWTSGGNPAGTAYLAQISLNANFTSAISSTTLNTSVTFINLIPNSTYFMQVSAVNQAGAATFPTPLPAALLLANDPIAAAPSNVQAAQVTANWGTNGNPVGTLYKAQISPDPSFISNVTSSSTLNAFTTFLNLAPNTTYYMQVQAFNRNNIATDLVPLPSILTSANLPGSDNPTNIQATQFTAHWTSGSNPANTSYQVLISTDSGFSSSTASVTTNLLTTFTGLTPNTTYFTKVTSLDAGGAPGGFTALPTVLTLAAVPAAPSAVVVLSTQVTAGWDANGNPAGTLYIAQSSLNASFNPVTSSNTFNTFAAFSALVPNTTYFIRVEAVNAGGAHSGFSSPPLVVVTLPNPPGVNVFSNVTASQLQANWRANGNPAGTTYQAVLSTAANPGTNGLGTNVSTTTTSLSTVFRTLTPNTLYFVDVKDFNGTTSSIYTSLGSTVTWANPPAAGAAPDVQSAQITAHWATGGNPDNTTYVAQISADPLFPFGTTTSSTTTTLSATFPGLLANTTYYMQVRALNAGGIPTVFTPLASAQTLASVPGADVPSNVQATQMTAHWTSGGNPANTPYQAEISSDPGFAASSASTTTNLFATFTSLSPNTTYYTRVKALNSASPFTSLGSTITLANLPAGGPLDVQSTQITAHWASGGNPANTVYVAEISADPGFAASSASTTTNLFADFSGLSPNTQYYLHVKALNSGGSPTSFFALGSTVTLSSLPGSAAPDVLTTQITAHWTSGGNPAGTFYLAQISPDPGFAVSATTSSTTTNLSANFGGLISNTTYYMRVAALNAGGNPSGFTALPPAVTLTNPPGTGAAADVQATAITVHWTSGGNSAGTVYLIQASTDSLFAVEATTSATTTNFVTTLSGLLPNTVYFSRAAAFNAGGSPSSFTSLPSALTLANPPLPAQPSNIQTNQLTANWGANSNPPGTIYVANISEDPNFTSGPSSTTANTFAAFTGLQANVTYYMEVLARNGAGVQTTFTLLPSTITRENAPGAPGGGAFSGISSTTLQANWSTIGNPSNTLYRVVISTGASPSTNGFAGNRSSTTLNASVLFSGLAVNTRYFAEVNATTSGGSSGYTNLTSISTWADVPLLGNPTNIQTNQITANWGGSGNPLGTLYIAKAATDSAFSSNVDVVSTTSLSATFTGLLPNTTYFMQVAAQNQDVVTSAVTLLPAAMTLPNSPSPTGFNGIGLTTLQANWNANGNPSGTIYEAILSTAANPSSNGFAGNQISTTTSTSAAFTQLSINTRYFVDIAVFNPGNSSAFVGMNTTGISTLANPPTRSDPTNIQANQITANWGSNGNPLGTFYLVQASLNAQFSSIAASVSTTSLSGVLSGLAGNTPYFMQVQAMNLDGAPTSFTSLGSTSTLDNPAIPPGPAGLSQATNSQIQANWIANGNPAGTIYTAILSSAPSPSTNGLAGNKTLTGTVTSAVFTGLAPNTFYYVEVKATNSNGDSSYTPLGSLATLANLPTPAAPTGIGPSQITVNWGANANPAGTTYLVEIALDPDFKPLTLIDVALTDTLSYIFTGLSANTTFYSRVEAFNQGGQVTGFVTLPPAQTIIAAPGSSGLVASQISDSSITWTWSSIPNAASYHLVDENDQVVSPTFGSSTLLWLDAGPTGGGLAVNTAYSRKLVAVNPSGSSTSTLVTAYTLAHQPTELAVKAVTSTSITIQWNANGNPLPTIYQASISQATGPGRVVTGPGTEATFDNLAGATTYFVSVKALNGAGAAADSGNLLTIGTAPQLVTSNSFCASTPNTIAFNGPLGQVRVDIPAGTFSQCVQMIVQIPTVFPDGPSSGTPLRGTGVGLQLDTDLSLQPGQPITLSIPFDNSKILDSERSQLVLARYDTVHNAWVMLPSRVDPDQNFVVGKTDHLSLYQIMVALPAGNLSAVRAYPNPFRPAMGHAGVTLVNLPAGASLQIFTLTGERVQDLTATPAGTAFWDGRNRAGQTAASGVYFIVIKSGSDKTIVKVAVQR